MSFYSVKTVVNKENAVSVLYIANAKKNDSGEYICSIGNLTQNAIYVHVINGKFIVYNRRIMRVLYCERIRTFFALNFF